MCEHVEGYNGAMMHLLWYRDLLALFLEVVTTCLPLPLLSVATPRCFGILHAQCYFRALTNSCTRALQVWALILVAYLSAALGLFHGRYSFRELERSQNRTAEVHKELRRSEQFSGSDARNRKRLPERERDVESGRAD